MDLDREPQKIARAAGDEIRALNHRTIDVKGFYGHDEDGSYISAAPLNASATVEALVALTDRLPQALQQISRAVQHLEEQQAIRMADGSDVADQVSVALRGLLDAEQAVKVANVHLREAGRPLANMGGHFSDDELEDVGITA
ncbi:hypothetical protein OG693_39425 (plasmid) [Streptomyces sp. NBC_01259]|uniref:hypothetical protein n=1 Tax=Streptomyces sp. NBC_01259 TaxID=2903800 RepID=UPI002F909F7C